MSALAAVARTLLPVALVSLAPESRAIPALFLEQAVFVSGQDGYHTFRIPALLRAGNGTLLAFAEGRKNSSSDTGDIDLVLRRSTDNGVTWGPLQVVWSDGANTCGNPAPVLDATGGVIRLLSTWNLGSDSESTIINGTSTDTRRVFLLSSSDEGATWSAPTEITATTKQPDWTWYATGPGAGIQLRRGAQAGRMIVACDHIVAGSKAFGSHVLCSDDAGATWAIGAVAATTATVRPNENLAVELVAPSAGGGSRLYFNARDHQGPNVRAQTWSDDGGASYTPVDFQDAAVFTTPVVQGGLARVRAADEGDAANRILFSCPKGTTRNRLSIWSSSDETATWSPPKTLHEGPSAYSGIARLDGERIGVLYEKGVSSPYETITLARFDEAWLDEPDPPAEAPGACFWNVEESPVGATASTAAGAIRDVHPQALNLHLTASRAFPVVAGSPAFGNGRALSFVADGGLFLADSDSGNRFDYGPAHSFTVEVVFRVPAGSTQIGALVAKDLAATSPSWWLRVESGRARFLVSDDAVESVLSSSAAIHDGNWHHVAAVRDASNPLAKQLRIYVDGAASGTVADTTTGSLANGQALWVGRFNSGARLFTGEIDAVRITPAALAPAAFLARATQFDADGDGIPDDFERAESAGLSTLGPEHLAGYLFGAVPPSAAAPPAGAGVEGGNLVITCLQREPPFWLVQRLVRSENFGAWSNVVPASTDYQYMAGGLRLRTDRLVVDGVLPAYFRYEVNAAP
jgi:sialidase-1